MTLDPLLARAVVALVIPVAVALVTKADAPSRLKAAVALVLSAVGALVTGALTDSGTAVISQAMLGEWALTTAMQLAAYLGLLKPIVDVNARALPDSGIG